jgi:hypothetical protein
LLIKLTIALGFPIEEASSIVAKSIKLVQSGADEDDFILSLK